MTSWWIYFQRNYGFYPYKNGFLHPISLLQKVQINIGSLRSLYTFTKFSEKLLFLTSWYAHIWVFIRGYEMLVFQKMLHTYRSSRPEVFCKKDVLRHVAKFTGKHLCQSLFLNKVEGRPATLLKKRLWHRCFLWILRNF